MGCSRAPSFVNCAALSSMDEGGEFAHIRENKFGSGGLEAVCVLMVAVAAACEAEHAHPGGASGFHACDAILDHEAGLRSMSHLVGRVQEEIRTWLSARDHLGGVDVRSKQVVKPRNPQRLM